MMLLVVVFAVVCVCCYYGGYLYYCRVVNPGKLRIQTPACLYLSKMNNSSIFDNVS